MKYKFDKRNHTGRRNTKIEVIRIMHIYLYLNYSYKVIDDTLVQ